MSTRTFALALGLALLAAPVAAMHREDLPEVQRLADRLVRSSDRLVELSGRRIDGFSSRRESWRERTLQRFSRSAERFRDTVDEQFDTSRRIVDALTDLNEDARSVGRVIDRGGSTASMRSEWDRTSRTLARINRLAADDRPSVQAAGEAPSRYVYRDGRYWTSDGRFYYRNGRWIEADDATGVKRTFTRHIMNLDE